MKKWKYLEVNLQDIIGHLIESVELGDAYSSMGRSIGNVEDGYGDKYTMTILVTKDEDQFGHDPSLPLLNPEKLSQGKVIIKAPEGHLDGKVVDESDLSFSSNL